MKGYILYHTWQMTCFQFANLGYHKNIWYPQKITEQPFTMISLLFFLKTRPFLQVAMEKTHGPRHNHQLRCPTPSAMSVWRLPTSSPAVRNRQAGAELQRALVG